MFGPGVLIAEDNPIVGMDLEATLAHVGYTVVGVADRVSTLTEMMERNEHDVLLLNIDLADGTTFAVARTSLKPFAFITAHETAELPDDLRNSPLLRKPFNSDDVVRLVESLAKHPGNRRGGSAANPQL